MTADPPIVPENSWSTTIHISWDTKTKLGILAIEILLKK